MSVFENEWRACLREQYKYVVCNNDQVTLQSLVQVLQDVGFTEDELAQLRVEATMRMEDVPDDFVPDLEILNTESLPPVEQPFQPHPLECQCPSCMEKTLAPHDDDGQPIPLESLDLENPEHKQFLEKQVALKDNTETVEDEDDENDSAQMSLF